MLGQWLTSAAKLAKNLAVRLVFIASLIVLLPLAVLNRQKAVTLAVNPLDVTRAAPETRSPCRFLSRYLPLFHGGLLVGWVMGYFSENKLRALPVARGMIKASQPKRSMSRPYPATLSQSALFGPFDGASAIG